MGYCEHCEREREGLVCPVCGRELLQEIDPEDASDWSPALSRAEVLSTWPLDAEGEPETAVLLENLPFQGGSGMLVDRLFASGIPVLPQNGAYLAGMDLKVPKSLAEEAMRLLREFHEMEAEA